MDHVGLFIAVDHNFRYICQPPGQRKRTDDSGKYRPVCDQLHRLFHRIQIDAGTACTYLRHLQGLCLLQGRDHTAHDGGNLIFRDADFRSEAFRFYREVHQTDGSGRIHPVGNELHASCLHGAVGDQFLHAHIHQLNSRE